MTTDHDMSVERARESVQRKSNRDVGGYLHAPNWPELSTALQERHEQIVTQLELAELSNHALRAKVKTVWARSKSRYRRIRELEKALIKARGYID